jgi:hypothetical protein
MASTGRTNRGRMGVPGGEFRRGVFRLSPTFSAVVALVFGSLVEA